MGHSNKGYALYPEEVELSINEYACSSQQRTCNY